MRITKCSGCLSLSLSMMFVAPAARADEAEPITLEYHAATTCPRAGEFVGQLQSRTTRVRFAEATEKARNFAVDITVKGTVARGQLTIRDVDGGVVTREVSGKTCAEVSDALVLIMALAIDPHAAIGPIAPPPKPEPPAPTAIPEAVRARDEPPPSERTDDSRPRWEVTAAMQGAAVVGVTVEALWGPRLSVEIAHRGPSVVAPTLRLGFERSLGTSRVDLEQGYATFSWTTGRVDLCPLRFGGHGRLGFASCAIAELGQLKGTGAEVVNPRSATRTWFAVGALGRLQLVLVGPLLLEVEAGVVTPVRNYEFFFAPDARIYRVPSAGARLGMGIAATLP